MVRVLPYGAITRGEMGEALSDMDALAEHVCAFSDDGRGVQSEEMMRAAMVTARSLGKLICAHCEDNSLLRGGYIHDGEYALLHGHRGICRRANGGPSSATCGWQSRPAAAITSATSPRRRASR